MGFHETAGQHNLKATLYYTGHGKITLFTKYLFFILKAWKHESKGIAQHHFLQKSSLNLVNYDEIHENQ